MSTLPEFLQDYCKATVSKEGFPHLFALSKNSSGEVNVFALLVPLDDLPGTIKEILRKEKPQEFLFYLDRFTRPGQGIEEPSVLCLHYLHEGNWEVGLLPYDEKSDPPQMGEIIWNPPPFWGDLMRANLYQMGLYGQSWQHPSYTSILSCPVCGERIGEIAPALGPRRAPESGDSALCGECGTVLTFEGDALVIAGEEVLLSLPEELQELVRILRDDYRKREDRENADSDQSE